jgi:predicted AlkP superfamily pyrophosphatase or phosphodiesterase
MLRQRILLLLAAAAPFGRCAEPVPVGEPRLVLQLTIDQLRGDRITKYRDKFGTGGFRRLLERGTWFTAAHHDAANTLTASGHAVLATGASTGDHGIVANDWFDRATGRMTYCVADARSPVIGEPAKPGSGVSPARLLTATIGDELVAGRPGRRAFAVAGKDRSAILPGGHRGQAYWFSESTGGFTTSTYYRATLPAWLEAWNATRPVAAYRTLNWTPLRATTIAANPHARPTGSLGRTFPHPLLAKSEALFLAAFSYTPFLDELTLAFTRELILAERIGRNGALDYLAVSLSSTDYIGHAYGPESVEAEDNLLRLDAVLANFLRLLDGTIGLDRVLIVLSADHGSADIPEALQERGLKAGRIQPAGVLTTVNAQLRRTLAVDTDLVQAFVPPGFYLDQARIAAAKLNPESVQSALAAAAGKLPGIAHAFEHFRLARGEVPATPLGERVRRSFHPDRSGDVVIIQEEFWYLYPDAERYAAMHGSPYDYDTHVPVIFSGPGVRSGIVTEPVTPAQIVPTLAALLGCRTPAGARSPSLLPLLQAGGGN